MKRFTLWLILLVGWTAQLQAASAPVTVEIREPTLEQYRIMEKNHGPIVYTLILKDGGKIVVSKRSDADGGQIPEAETFPTQYCGVSAQVVVLKTNFCPSGAYTGAASCGYIYDFLIYDPKGWGLMDEFSQFDMRDGAPPHEWTDRSDAAHSIAMLRAGRYYGPKCRIYDLYTQPLPAKGPSFDCKTASSRAEDMVCKNPQLAALDRAYGTKLRERLLKASPADRQALANGYYWDMMIRDRSATSVKDLAEAYRKALGGDTAKFFQEKTPARDAKAACEQARTPTEKAICAHPALKTLDSQMAQAYHQAFARTAPKTAERQTLIQDQRKWLKSRDRCQADVACLSSAYRERIASLQAALPAKDQQVTP